MGFSREAVEAVSRRWAEIESLNQVLERLRGRRVDAVAPKGAAEISKVVWKIAGFQQAILYRMVMLADGCADAWNGRNVLAALLCSRALIETAVVVFDFEAQLKQYCDKGDFPAIDKLVMNRTFATRQKAWHEQATGVEAVNVLTLIDRLDKKIEGARHHYDFLSEMCHPNSMGHKLMFGSLDKDARTLQLSDRKPFSEPFFDHVTGGFGLIELTEYWLDEIDKLLPRVLTLSEASRNAGRRSVGGHPRDYG